MVGNNEARDIISDLTESLYSAVIAAVSHNKLYYCLSYLSESKYEPNTIHFYNTYFQGYG